MYKSDIDIKDEIYLLLKNSDLMQTVTGTLSKRKRPTDSKKEDVLISVSANRLAEAQEAFVNVNIYVADKRNGKQYEENDQRLRELCQLALQALEGSHRTFYLHVEEQRVLPVEGLNESFINNRILYKTINS